MFVSFGAPIATKVNISGLSPNDISVTGQAANLWTGGVAVAIAPEVVKRAPIPTGFT